jgi:glycosyltransferase involved in cell wall biosynthesis
MKPAVPLSTYKEPVIRSRKVLLVSTRVMHYRVSVYNYFHRRFRESGFEFSVLADCLQEQNQTLPEFDLRELPFNFFQYKQAIEETSPDVVILFLWMRNATTWPLIHWLKLRGTPFAWWTKGGNWDAKNSRLRYEVSNYIHGISNALILYSSHCMELVKPCFHAKSFIANNTLNFEDFPLVHESKEEIKKEFGIPFHKVVLFIGRMGVGKGRKRVDHLIDMFRGLDRSDIGLVLVGSGLSEELNARMNTHNTLYLGEVHDARNLAISKLCKMADICAIPGHVGLGLNQALYWGLPVVTEECDQPPEISYLRHGQNGFIVPRDDLQALQDRILYLLDNDAVRAEFSAHARDRIIEDASIEKMFSGFKNCVEHLIACNQHSLSSQ